MTSRGRLDRIEQGLRAKRHEDAPENRYKKAVAAGADGTWSWDDARLVFGDRAAELRLHIVQDRLNVMRYLRPIRLHSANGLVSVKDHPVGWGMTIVTFDLDEEVPEVLVAKFQETVERPARWNVHDLDVVACAVLYMLVLESPDALELRREIWTPRTPKSLTA